MHLFLLFLRSLSPTRSELLQLQLAARFFWPGVCKGNSYITLISIQRPPAFKQRLQQGLVGGRSGDTPLNDQYRICFRWEKEQASEVEIVDYHP